MWIDSNPFIASAIVFYGALSLGIVFQYFLKSPPAMGLAHVVDRVTHYHGRLTLRSAVLQFFSAIWCILTGQSSGREGPAIHLGAATSSLVGQYCKLPSNSIRILAGCGSAAAISASFNTPIAGVIFAMEVILMEYTVVGFIPIILAACSGTLISHWVYGASPAFEIPNLGHHGLIEVPIYIAIGIAAGALSAGFCFLFKQCLKFKNLPISVKFGCAGLLTAFLGYFVPETIGIGYFNVENALSHQLGLGLLIAITLTKLITSSVTQAMGMPTGIIGPTLVAGACLGSTVLVVTNGFLGGSISADALYPMIGMGAMMAAVINAPLAALTALVELTGTTQVIFPAMIGIVIANMTCRELFKQKSPHLIRLEFSGKGKNASAFELALQKVGVSSLMNRSLMRISSQASQDELTVITIKKPRWLLIKEGQQNAILINGLDFIASLNNGDTVELLNNNKLSILSLPLEHYPVVNADVHLSALEAWEIMQSEQTQILVIEGTEKYFSSPTLGTVTRQDFENYFHQPRYF